MKSIAKALRDTVKEMYGDERHVTFRNNYSGRGMYGKNCVGLVGAERDINKVIAEVFKQQRQELSDAFYIAHDAGLEDLDTLQDIEQEMDSTIDMLLDSQRDSMGMQVIVYWPDIASLPDEECDEDEY